VTAKRGPAKSNLLAAGADEDGKGWVEGEKVHGPSYDRVLGGLVKYTYNEELGHNGGG
jgi:hypothetical protein